MSRVFVSCAVRDRATGERVSDLVRSLGHEAEDDQDEANGTAWWNEVVGRIEASDVFVAVATPAYAEAHACRLAAKHAESTGLPVVRVDLAAAAVAGCHPVVASAVGVPFAPEDPEAVVLLAHALMGSPDEAEADTGVDDDVDVEAVADAVVGGSAGRPALEEAPAPSRQLPPPSRPRPTEVSGADDPPPSDVPWMEGVMAAVVLLCAVGLVYIGLGMRGSSEPAPDAGPVAQSTSPATTQSAGTQVAGSLDEAPDPQVAALLAGVRSLDNPRLPADSCRAGATAVTCVDPAPNIRTVVLTPYPGTDELYAAYAEQVEELGGDPAEENTGSCSSSGTEGELGWNVDGGESLDHSVADQVAGGLDPTTQSAGRVFCTESQEVMRLAWTQDPGLLVTVRGQPSELVLAWWSEVHLQLACGSGLTGSGCAGS